ncbi:hypothetical protein BC832DRAFT_449503 [Gaertneriomyces semiglobifer]|nr:hypothetical protein BC832DRAFT_449503 [Gaertneriomyces semiglobifer]
MLKTWKDGTLAAAVAPKMPDEQRLLAAALATQRIKEAKLQILMLLECLRLAHPEKGILLPCLRHWCEQPTIEPLPKTDSASVHLRKRKSSITTSEDNTKSKRRKASSGRDDTAVNTQEQRVADFRRAVEDLVDHIGIWRAISGVNSADDDLMKTFVEPVLIKYYQSYFPKLVKSLVLRVGGDPDRHKVVPPSPLFKKRSRSDRKGNAKASSNPSSTAPTVKASSRPNAALSSKTKALSTGLITALGKRQIAIGAKTGASAPSSRNVKGRGSEMSKITNAASHTRSTDNAVVVRRASSTLSMKSHSQFGLASRSMSASTDGERRKSQHIVLGSRPSVLERLERARTLDVPEEAAKIFNDRPPLVPSTPTRKSRKSMHTPTHLRGGGSQRKETYALDEFQESNVIDTPCSRKSKRSSSSLFFEGLSVPAYQRSPSVTPTKKRTSRRSSLIHVDESPTSARQNRKSLIHASPSPLLPDTPSVIFPTTDTPTRRSRVSFPRGAGTPTATPGSCKRLQNMLEGFADFDWDEDEDEVLPNTPVKQRR